MTHEADLKNDGPNQTGSPSNPGTPQADEQTAQTVVPTRWIGPIRISGNTMSGTAAAAGPSSPEEIEVPLATYETPLWPSVGRGAKVSRQVEAGIAATIVDERMTRSVMFTAHDGATAHQAAQIIQSRFDELAEVVNNESRYAQLIEIHPEIVGSLLFVRFAFRTGDASGHNMTTAVADVFMTRILSWDIDLAYGSISGNFCTDKKATGVNGVLGRGRSVTADILIPHDVVEDTLKTTSAQIADLVVQKNYVGSSIAGALRSANAHFANMLLAFYLATGQDAANIVEGSQGFTYAENRPDGLYFSCTLPHLIVGTIGNGKHLPHVEEAIVRLGLREEREPGENTRRLAGMIAASVLCGELSLLAAQTNPGELMAAHTAFERRPR